MKATINPPVIPRGSTTVRLLRYPSKKNARMKSGSRIGWDITSLSVAKTLSL
jgi:hypothetical protein